MVIEKVLTITKYPLLAVHAHTGITMFAPEMYSYFRKMVSLDVESSFEKVICPVIAKEYKLFAINFSLEVWIPVNDLKGLEAAAGALKC